jgi:glycosyltransferase involved in cell wall biosynthesis
MRILQVSSASSIGGGERYVIDLSNALVSRGHEVHVALRPKSPLVNHLNVPAENIKTVPLRNALDALSARELARYVEQHQIDVVHAHMARDYSIAAYGARRRREARFIVTRHVMFPLSRLHRRTLSGAARVIAVSAAVARELRAQRIVRDEQIALVRNGVDVDRFARARLNFDRAQFLNGKNLPAESLLIGSIGELRALKRHDDFIRSAAIVAAQFDNTHFVIAGIDTSKSGEVRKHLKDLVGELGLDQRVHFLGWLDDADKLLCALDVFVSASETESFGLVIAEAMAAGTAVVATATDGAKEVVSDQKTGLLVEIGNVVQLSEAIVTLLKDERLRKSMGASGMETARSEFSLTRMVDEIERIYSMSDML